MLSFWNTLYLSNILNTFEVSLCNVLKSKSVLLPIVSQSVQRSPTRTENVL